MDKAPGPRITNICLRKCTYAYFGAITYVVCKYMFFGKHKSHLRSAYAKKIKSVSTHSLFFWLSNERSQHKCTTALSANQDKCKQSLLILRRECEPSEFSKLEHPKRRHPNFPDEEIICLSREINLWKSGPTECRNATKSTEIQVKTTEMQ